jgi:uncharacterized protein YbjQ (UPF0145 family)
MITTNSSAACELAIRRACEAAAQLGANALLGLRLEPVASPRNTSIELFAYGTAALVTPIPAGQPGATKQSAKEGTRAAE